MNANDLKFNPCSDRPGVAQSPGRTGVVDTQRDGGMTLVELLLSFVVFSVIFGGLILVSQSLRNEACDRETRDTLRQLRNALQAYHDRHNRPPVETATPAVIQSLLADAASAGIVRRLEPNKDSQGQVCIKDGYGNPVRYTIQSRRDSSGADFLSAGPDGQFGDLTSEHADVRDPAADNMYGWDLEALAP